MIKQLVQCTALEGAYFHIRVNAVAASVIKTERAPKLNQQDRDVFKIDTQEKKDFRHNKKIELLSKDIPLKG